MSSMELWSFVWSGDSGRNNDIFSDDVTITSRFGGNYMYFPPKCDFFLLSYIIRNNILFKQPPDLKASR